MKFIAPFCSRTTSAPGFTLIEMMVATALSSLLFASVVAIGMYTGKSFYMMGNDVDLDAQSRHAADVLGRLIRNSNALVSYSTGSSPFLKLTNSTIGKTITITYNPNNSTLMLAETGLTTETLLTDCDSWTFSLFNRAPITSSFTTNIAFYSATNAATCKIIDMSWTCSRKLLGRPFNTESVQTAEIVLRNQITQ
jgi:prepilin-type N-terminal cleavage/methylation domain-containing protein